MSITSEGNQVTDSLNGKLTFEQNKNRIVGRDGDNVPRLAIVADGENFSMKVSPIGLDVLVAADSDLIFNSGNNLFKIVESGTDSLNYDGSVNTYLTIPHGLSSIPIVLAYVQLPNNANFNPMAGHYVPMPLYQLRTGLPSVQCVQTVDATNIYLRVHDVYASGGSPQLYNFRYYVLQETAN